MSQRFWSLLTWLQVFFSVQMCPDDEQPHHFVGSDIKHGEHDLVSSKEQIQSKPAWSGYPPGWWIVKEWHSQIYLTISLYKRYKTIWYNWLYIFMCVKQIFDLLLVMCTLYILWLYIPRSQMTLVLHRVRAFFWSGSSLNIWGQTVSIYMGVSKNSGTPKSSILIGFSIINHPFWGTPIFGNTHHAKLKALSASGLPLGYSVDVSDFHQIPWGFPCFCFFDATRFDDGLFEIFFFKGKKMHCSLAVPFDWGFMFFVLMWFLFGVDSFFSWHFRSRRCVSDDF